MTDDKLPMQSSDAFLKVSRDKLPPLTAQQRAALVRKGNEFFNGGRIEDAKRIFLTAGYTDGLVRLGDYYYKRSQPLEAFRMYWLAPDSRRTELLAEKMAGIIRKWLSEERTEESRRDA
ncbi:MAG TPA: hypothetical protein VMW87_05575 [Spirochaetia bacterium]|nr:hypothetical protein [Spirochaetia bacterium]